MIGTAPHTFDVARSARKGMSQARLSRKSPTSGRCVPTPGQPATWEAV